MTEHIIDTAQHLTPLNFGLVLAGLLIHIGMKLIKIQRKKGLSFRIALYWQHNYIQILVSTMCAFLVMFFADNFSEGVLDIHVHSESNFYSIFAVAAGFNNQVLFDQLMKKNT